MFIRALFFISICLLVPGSRSVLSQETAEPPPPPRVILPVLREVGTAKVKYWAVTDHAIAVSATITADGGHPEKLEFRVEFQSRGKKVAKPETVDLIIVTTSPDRKYVADSTIKLIVDDVPLSIPPSKAHGSFTVGQTIKVVVVQTITFADLNSIAKAKRLRLAVGPAVFDLKRTDLVAIRDVIKTVD